MFGSSNKGIMSIVYGGIVFAIAMVFIVQFRPNSGQQTASLQQQCVANIRDRCIEPKEFHAAFGLAVPRGADEKRVRAMGVRRQVIEGLVERSLLNQDAERLGLTVSDDEINAELVKGRFRVSLPAQVRELAYYLGLTPDGVRLMDVTSSKTSKFDYESYKRVVRLTTNRSPNEFKEMQREEIIAARMRNMIATRATVSDAEAFATYQREKQSAKVEYVSLHREYFARNYLDTSPKAVEAWAKDHQKDIDETWKSRKDAYPAGCRVTRHIMIALQSVASTRGHEREEAQSLIEKARQRIAAGDSFNEVAKDLSEDEGSAAKGGELGCVVKGKWPKPFEDAVFGAAKTGMIETVVETPAGFHLIEVEAIVPEDAAKAEQVARGILAKELMTSMEAENLTSETAKKIREAAAGGKPLKEALDQVIASLEEQRGTKKKDKAKPADAKPADAKKDKPSDPKSKDAPDKTEPEADEPVDPMAPKVETSAPFSVEEQPIDGVAKTQNVARMAFGMKPGEIASDLVQLNDGYAILRLVEKKEVTREEFDKERDEYLERLLAAKRADLVTGYISRLRDAATNEIKISEKWAQEPKGANDDS